MSVVSTTTSGVLPMWIDGKAVAASSTRTTNVTNPATGEVVRKAPMANPADVDAAVKAAVKAFPGWRDTPPLRRSRILTRFRELLEAHRDEFAQLITQEHGKTLPDAAGSLQRGIEVVEFASGVPHLLKGEHAEDVGKGIDCHSMLQPLGVCTGITPFNFPVMVPLWMFPVSIACGNTFVLKPSEKDPSPALRMAELFKEAGLPDGVLNVVHGDKEAVDALLVHPDIRAVSFVGSTPIARYVYETATRNGKRCRPWAERRITRWFCQMRISNSPPTPWSGRIRLRWRALHGGFRGRGRRRDRRQAGRIDSREGGEAPRGAGRSEGYGDGAAGDPRAS